MIIISVIYAAPEKQLEISLEVEESCTVALAIKRSQLFDHFPELTFANITVGIFSKLISLDANLNNGDRIEIYRPLLIDPKNARRLRASQIRSHIHHTIIAEFND